LHYCKKLKNHKSKNPLIDLKKNHECFVGGKMDFILPQIPCFSHGKMDFVILESFEKTRHVFHPNSP
jgi:hypothetical protein